MFKRILLIGSIFIYIALELETISYSQGPGTPELQTTDMVYKVFLPLVVNSNRATVGLAMPVFDDIAPSLGVDLVVTTYGPNPVDYNQDGLLDLMFTNHLDILTLYQQQPSGDFVDVAPASGIVLGDGNPLDYGDKHGAAWGDCDNDGYLDLYISMGTQQANRLYHNLGNDTFVDIADQSGVADAGRGRAASWIDYDNDGDLDLFGTNAELEGSGDRLFRNEGDCTFSNVSAQVGELTSRFHKFGMAWADYDNDGDMDVFATSGVRLPSTMLDFFSHLYHNNGDGTFSDVTTVAGILEEAGNGMAWGDYDNDSDLDLFVTKGYSPGVSTPPSVTNRLYRNNGDGTFVQVAEMAGVAQNLNSQEALWVDFDNDGDLDLYVTNAGTLAGGSQPNFLYENQGDGTFQEVAASVGATGTAEGMRAGAAFGDIDADGFLDIVITHGLSTFSVEGPHQVLHNQGNEAHWLQVKLIGQQSNRLGIGARVELTTADGLFQMREMNGGAHHYAQDELLLAFGLGERTHISQLTIYWPSGVVQRLTDLEVDQRLTIFEAETSEPTPTPTHTPTPTATSTPAPTDTPTPTSTPPSDPIELIIDNLNPEFTTVGFWNTSSDTRYPSYEDNFRFTGSGSGNRQATFTPNIIHPGDYEVFIWFFTTPKSATNTPYTINFNGGSTTIRLNHQGAIGGGDWYSLGIYHFASGTSGNIIISNDADGSVEADAVRLVRQQ